MSMEVYLPALLVNYARPTNQPTDRPRPGHREVTLPVKYEIDKNHTMTTGVTEEKNERQRDNVRGRLQRCSES